MKFRKLYDVFQTKQLDPSIEGSPLFNPYRVPIPNEFQGLEPYSIQEVLGQYLNKISTSVYSGNWQIMDYWLFQNFGDRILIPELEENFPPGKPGSYEFQSRCPSYIQNIWYRLNAWFSVNNEKYKRLYEIQKASFNPIENYDRYESTTTVDGLRTDETNNGKRTSSIEYGNSEITNSYDSVDTTNVFGNTQDTQTNGATSSNTEVKAFGYNNSNGRVADNTKTTTESNTVTNSSVAHTDTTTVDPRIDSTSVSAKVDNTTQDASIDTFKKGEQSNTIESHIHGNIGVTTAVAMMKEAKDFYSEDFNSLYEILMLDILDQLTLPMYE